MCSFPMSAHFRETVSLISISHFSQFSSVAQSCPTFCNPIDMPGFPVHHQLLELSQTHVPEVSDAIQPSHPLSSPSQHSMSVIIQIPYSRGTLTWVSVSIIILIYFLLLSPLIRISTLLTSYDYRLIYNFQSVITIELGSLSCL